MSQRPTGSQFSLPVPWYELGSLPEGPRSREDVGQGESRYWVSRARSNEVASNVRGRGNVTGREGDDPGDALTATLGAMERMGRSQSMPPHAP